MCLQDTDDKMIKIEDNNTLVSFVNHMYKLCGHTYNFIRSCTYPL
jgi:hypothetical protein